MRRSRTRIVCLNIARLALGLGLWQAGVAWTDGALAASMGKIGYFDYKYVVQHATMGRQAVQAIEAERQRVAKAIEALDKEMEDVRQQLTAKEPAKLSLEEAKKQQEGLRLKLQELNDKKLDTPREREKRKEKVNRELRNTVKEVVNEYAKEQGFAMIFNRARGNPFYAEKELDISDAIVERLNRKASASAAPEGEKK